MAGQQVTAADSWASTCNQLSQLYRHFARRRPWGSFEYLGFSHLGLNGNHVLHQVCNPVRVTPALKQTRLSACCCQSHEAKHCQPTKAAWLLTTHCHTRTPTSQMWVTAGCQLWRQQWSSGGRAGSQCSQQRPLCSCRATTSVASEMGLRRWQQPRLRASLSLPPLGSQSDGSMYPPSLH